MKLAGNHFFLAGITILGASLQGPSAATYPAGFTEKQVGAGLISPSGMDFAPDGRLFIGQQKGQIRLVKNDTLLSTPVINFQSKVDYNTERGVMGLVVDPNFANNHYLYIYYTAKSPTSHNRLSRFTVNGDIADTAETVLFDLPTLPTRDGGTFTSINVPGTTTLSVWHMGGGLDFGNDGKIYIAVGEHEVTNSQAAQQHTNLWGKVLRLNPDGSIPTNNPFYGSDTGQNRAIWALGFRNPYTMAVQRSTGKIFIGNVGEGTWEDVDTVAVGRNYGWPVCEGSHVKGSTTALCAASNNFVIPLFTYRHGTTTSTGNCAIAGGFTNSFRAQDTGKYFFADFTNNNTVTGWIKRVNPLNGADTATFATGVSNITGLKFSPSGDMFYITRGYSTGTIDTASATYLTKSKVFKVTYLNGTAINARRNESTGLLINLGGNSILIPGGMSGFQLYDLTGKKVWEARDLKVGESLTMPAGLNHGMLKYRWLPATL